MKARGLYAGTPCPSGGVETNVYTMEVCTEKKKRLKVHVEGICNAD